MYPDVIILNPYDSGPCGAWPPSGPYRIHCYSSKHLGTQTALYKQPCSKQPDPGKEKGCFKDSCFDVLTTWLLGFPDMLQFADFASLRSSGASPTGLSRDWLRKCFFLGTLPSLLQIHDSRLMSVEGSMSSGLLADSMRNLVEKDVLV